MKKLSIKNGFTLIELITSITVMAIIGTMSLAAFSSYNSKQVLQASTADIVDTLTLAKSRAVSQIVDSQCANQTVTAYQVAFTLTNPNQYVLQVVCGGVTYSTSVAKKLPKNVTFQNTTAAKIVFNAGTGIVATPGTIVIVGYGSSKTITVGVTGTISVQ